MLRGGRNGTSIPGFCLCLLNLGALAVAFATGNKNNANLKPPTAARSSNTAADDYDIVIIGAGASGLFASGAALSFGWKTLLLDLGKGYVGGDCSNAACVPSKALRSMARMQANNKDNNPILEAQEHVLDTVMAVRNREDIRNFDNVTNLDLTLVESSKFVSQNEMEIVPREDIEKETIVKRIRSKKFLIATGASPIVPSQLQKEALAAGLPLFTYRDILSPGENSSWEQFCSDAANTPKHVIIAGGGPTAVELGQSLARLQLKITIIAPTTLLPDEDVSLQRSACQILRHDGIHLCFGRRVEGVNATNRQVILDDQTQLPADALLLCMGREPTVKDLNLEAAGIAWNSQTGVEVHPSSLQSTTNPRVFACGDCSSAVQGKDRKASHAAWTGYHAIRNMGLPKLLWMGSDSVHPTVPSVTYSDPELASVGMTRSDCIEKYGQDGFFYQSIREEGMDRADMERKERFVEPCFVELRAHKRSGRILGLTACGPAAAELANEIGLAIQCHLTVRDLARSIHSYPSHGYLLYRLGLSMALSDLRGFLDTLGPVGRLSGKLYGGVSAVVSILKPSRLLPWKRAKRRKQQQWEACGQRQVMTLSSLGKEPFLAGDASTYESLPISFLDYYNTPRREKILNEQAFAEWLVSKYNRAQKNEVPTQILFRGHRFSTLNTHNKTLG